MMNQNVKTTYIFLLSQKRNKNQGIKARMDWSKYYPDFPCNQFLHKYRTTPE